MVSRWMALDLASAPLPDAVAFMDPVSAPSNYKDPEKIAAYVAEKTAERMQYLALDPDLARITHISARGYCAFSVSCHDEDTEAQQLRELAKDLKSVSSLVTYNGFNFDLPLLMRRAKYLGVEFPAINTDRYRSPHVDLCEVLSDRNPQRRRPLNFYVKRLGWTDLLEKPLAGADEARVFETGAWDLLKASCDRDVEATERLAKWAGVIQ